MNTRIESTATLTAMAQIGLKAGSEAAGGAGMNTVFPQLRIEHLENGLIRLEDDSSLETCVLVVHPLQVRHMAKNLGFVREMSASDADMLATVRGRHADAVRTVLILKRRMLALKKRIDHLGNWLCTQSDSEHADLSYEMDYATATADICDEFCADLDDLVSMAGDGAGATPAVPAVSRVTNALASGAASTSENPAETQRVTRKASATAAPASGQQKDLLT